MGGDAAIKWEEVQTVKLDKKGRMMTPKALRHKAQLKEGSFVRVKADGRKILMEPLGPIADKYFGAFKITRWPEDFITDVNEVAGRDPPFRTYFLKRQEALGLPGTVKLAGATPS